MDLGGLIEDPLPLQMLKFCCQKNRAKNKGEKDDALRVFSVKNRWKNEEKKTNFPWNDRACHPLSLLD